MSNSSTFSPKWLKGADTVSLRGSEGEYVLCASHAHRFGIVAKNADGFYRLVFNDKRKAALVLERRMQNRPPRGPAPEWLEERNRSFDASMLRKGRKASRRCSPS